MSVQSQLVSFIQKQRNTGLLLENMFFYCRYSIKTKILSMLGMGYFLKIAKINFQQEKPICPNGKKLVPTKHNEFVIKIPVTVRRSISKRSHQEKIGDCEQSKRKMDCHFDRKQPESHVFQIIMRTRLSDSIDISQIAVKSTATHLQLIIIIKNKWNFTHFWHTAKLYK